jgi:hypothetical protein
MNGIDDGNWNGNDAKRANVHKSPNTKYTINIVIRWEKEWSWSGERDHPTGRQIA